MYTMHLLQIFVPFVYSNSTESRQNYYNSAVMRPSNGEGAPDREYISVMPTPRSSALQQPQSTLSQSSAHSKSVGLDVRELSEFSSNKHVYLYASDRGSNLYDEIDDDYSEPSPRYT